MKQFWLAFIIIFGFGYAATDAPSQAVAGRADPNKPQVEVSSWQPLFVPPNGV